MTRNNKPSPLVSVVVPTFNRANVLSRAIDSVLNQTFEDLELLIVDDGSTDETETLVESYSDSRIEYIHLDGNSGANTARNIGMQNASGTYIAFLDSDDEWKHSKIARQVELFYNSSENVGVVYTGLESIDGNGDVIGVNASSYSGEVAFEMFCDKLPGLFSTAMIKKEAYSECGPLDENLRSGQDWVFFTKCALHWEFDCIAKPLVKHHHQQSNRISRNHNPKQKHQDYINEFGGEINKLGFVDRRRVKAAHMAKIANSYLSYGEYELAREYFVKSLSNNPAKLGYYVRLIAALGGERFYKSLQKIKRTAVSILN